MALHSADTQDLSASHHHCCCAAPSPVSGLDSHNSPQSPRLTRQPEGPSARKLLKLPVQSKQQGPEHRSTGHPDRPPTSPTALPSDTFLPISRTCHSRRAFTLGPPRPPKGSPPPFSKVSAPTVLNGAHQAFPRASSRKTAPYPVHPHPRCPTVFPSPCLTP